MDYGNKRTADSDFTWKQVGEAVNDYLLDVVKTEEDALVGQFFLKEDEITDPNVFVDKLLGYLWSDAARYSDGLFVQHKFADVQATFIKTRRLSDVLTLEAFKNNATQGGSPVGNQDDED